MCTSRGKDMTWRCTFVNRDRVINTVLSKSVKASGKRQCLDDDVGGARKTCNLLSAHWGPG